VQARPRVLHLILLIAAVAAPVMYLLALARFGSALLYTDVSRLVVAYLALALAAGAATYLVLNDTNVMLRAAALVSLLAILGSIAYAELLWRPDIARSMAEVERRVFEEDQTGILVAAADDTSESLGSARIIESAVRDTLVQSGLGDAVAVRPSQPLRSESQVRTLASELNANLVVWASTRQAGTRVLEDWHITVLGATGRAATLDPMALLLAGVTQGTFTVSIARDGGNAATEALVRDLIMPVVTGFAFMTENQPLLAATQFDRALQYPGLESANRSQLQSYMGATLLAHGRSDLASEAFKASLAVEPSARAWIGLGNVAVADHQYDQAVEAYSNAVALDPYSPVAYCGLGYVHATRRDIHNAYLAYQQAIAIDPGFGVPYAFMGLLYELRADVAAAQKAYQQAASLVRFDRGMHSAITRRSDEIRQNPPTPVPTASPRPAPTASPFPTSAVHYVQPNDTLQAIAEKYGVSISEIVEINSLEDINQLFVGEMLLIPPRSDQ
jgi:tetratricopeptide (TPR) repeat protein